MLKRFAQMFIFSPTQIPQYNVSLKKRTGFHPVYYIGTMSENLFFFLIILCSSTPWESSRSCEHCSKPWENSSWPWVLQCSTHETGLPDWNLFFLKSGIWKFSRWRKKKKCVSQRGQSCKKTYIYRSQFCKKKKTISCRHVRKRGVGEKPTVRNFRKKIVFFFF